MNDTSKTIIISVFMGCVTYLLGHLVGLWLNLTHQITDKNIITDKFTNCLQVSMSESRQSGKIIDIKEAKEICKEVYATEKQR